MLDRSCRIYIDPPLNFLGALAARAGLRPNMLTALGLIFGFFCFGALVYGAYIWALFFLACSRLFDGLDGTVARLSKTGATNLGGYYDIVADFIFYGGFVFSFALGAVLAGDVALTLPACFLLFSFMASGGSFLAYAAIDAKINTANDTTVMSAPKHQNKSFHYAAGLCEGTETIIFFTLMCLMPQYFAYLAYGFGALCFVTALGRTLQARQAFKA